MGLEGMGGGGMAALHMPPCRTRCPTLAPPRFAAPGQPVGDMGVQQGQGRAVPMSPHRGSRFMSRLVLSSLSPWGAACSGAIPSMGYIWLRICMAAKQRIWAAPRVSHAASPGTGKSQHMIVCRRVASAPWAEPSP